MSAPTARDLLAEISTGSTPALAWMLAARVEAVLALHSRRTSSGACAECLGGASDQECSTVRLLDGVQQ